jgi:hypothetical protein
LLAISLAATLSGQWGRHGAGRDASAMTAVRDVYGIEVPIALSTVPALWLDRGRLTLDRLPAGPTATPPGPLDKPGEARPRSSIRLLLDQPQFRLGTAANATGTTEQPASTYGPDPLSPLVSQLAAVAFDGLRIQRGSLQFGSAADALTSIDATLTRDDGGGLTIVGQARYREVPLRFSLQAGPITAAAPTAAAGGPAAQRTVNLRVDAEGIGQFVWQSRLRGDLTVDVEGRIDLRTPNPFAVAAWLGMPVRPLDGLRDLALSGDVAWRRGEPVRLTVGQLQFDRQKPATGALAMSAVGTRPRIDGTLAFATLDLGPYAHARGQPGGGERPGWQELPLMGDGLRDLDLDIRLSAGAVQIGDQQLGRTAASIVARDGVVTLDVADAVWNGQRGSVRVTSEVTTEGVRTAARGRIELTDAAILAGALLGDRSLVTGPLTTAFDLRATGATLLGELGPLLTGRLSLVSTGRGLRLWLDPQRLTQLADALVRGRPLSGGAAPWVGTAVPLDDLDVRLALEPATVLLERALLRAKSAAVQISGRIDRATGRLDATGEVLPPADPKDRSPRRSEAGPRTVFGLSGPWTQPELVSGDWRALQP